MTTRDEDELWKRIVENYGDRAVLDDEPTAEQSSGEKRGRGAQNLATPGVDETGPLPEGPSRSPLLPGPEPLGQFVPPPAPGPFVPHDMDAPASEGLDDASSTDPVDDVHGFVAPDPPLPTMEPRRWLAWLAVLGAPVAFVLSAFLNITLNGLVAAALALVFVGGFLWLVASMPREPGDPWDDGARV